MKKTKFHQRYRLSMENLKKGNVEDSQGNLFVSDSFQWNSDTLKVLHSGVDTVKQLYSGLIDPDMYQQITDIFNVGHGNFLELVTDDAEVFSFMVSSGRKGGYRYALINQDLGVVVLIGSNYLKESLNGSHLKIELSPHLIYKKGATELQDLMDWIAKQFMTQVVNAGVAVHICCDIQGLEITDDLDRLLTTRTRRKINRSGLSEVNLALMATKYGAGQSFLFGRADSVQFAVYRKDIEATENDKMHFWGPIWNDALDDNLESVYDREKPVWRIELRFHHTAIDELGRDQGLVFRSYIEAVDHLTGFWRYGLDNCYRLDMNHRYIHPAWQYLIESVFIPARKTVLFTRRVKKMPGEGNKTNIALAYGNLLSIYARNRFPVRYAIQGLRQSGMWRDFVKYWEHKTGIYNDLSMLSALILKDVETKLKQRTIGLGIAA